MLHLNESVRGWGRCCAVGLVGWRVGAADGECLLGPTAAFSLYPFRLQENDVTASAGSCFWAAPDCRPSRSARRYNAFGLTVAGHYDLDSHLGSLFLGPSYQLVEFD